MGMLPIIWSSGTCPALPNFFHINGTIFEKKKIIEYKICDFLSNCGLTYFPFYEEFSKVLF